MSDMDNSRRTARGAVARSAFARCASARDTFARGAFARGALARGAFARGTFVPGAFARYAFLATILGTCGLSFGATGRPLPSPTWTSATAIAADAIDVPIDPIIEEPLRPLVPASGAGRATGAVSCGTLGAGFLLMVPVSFGLLTPGGRTTRRGG